MRLEKLVKGILMPAIVSSAIFLASCEGSSGDGKNGKNSTPANGGTQTVPSHVVSAGDVSSYSPSTGTIYFSSPVNFNDGDIVSSGITSAAPNGFLRKISWISQDKKNVYTQVETLEDAVRDTGKNIMIVVNPTRLHPANARFFPAKMEINQLNYYAGYDFGASLNNFVLFDLDGNQNTANDQLRANGYILFNTGFSTVLDIEKNLPPYFSFENLSDEELMLEVSSENSFNNLSKKILIGEFLFDPIVIGYIPTAVPIPIIAVPRNETYLNFSGSISSIKTSVRQSASVTGRIEYNQGWDFSKTFSKSFYFAPPNLPKSANFQASLSQRLDILLYGIAGPYGEVEGILDFHSNGSSWELHEGLEALIGVDGDILGNSFDYSKKVLEFDELLASGSLGAGGGNQTQTTITIQPGTDGKDAYVKYSNIEQNFANSNFGNYPTLEILEGNGRAWESFIQFPFSAVPAGATINNAKLGLYGYCVSNYSSPVSVHARKVLSGWSESLITWNNSPPYNSSGSTISMPNSGTQNWHEWDIASLVQEWVNGASSNYGLSLSLGNGESECKFKSSEDSNSSLRPKLVVTYSQ